MFIRDNSNGINFNIKNMTDLDVYYYGVPIVIALIAGEFIYSYIYKKDYFTKWKTILLKDLRELLIVNQIYMILLFQKNYVEVCVLDIKNESICLDIWKMC